MVAKARRAKAALHDDEVPLLILSVTPDGHALDADDVIVIGRKVLHASTS